MVIHTSATCVFFVGRVMSSLQVLKLIFTDPKAILMGPAQASFGFCAELMGLYVSVEICKASELVGATAGVDLPSRPQRRDGAVCHCCCRCCLMLPMIATTRTNMLPLLLVGSSDAVLLFVWSRRLPQPAVDGHNDPRPRRTAASASEFSRQGVWRAGGGYDDDSRPAFLRRDGGNLRLCQSRRNRLVGLRYYFALCAAGKTKPTLRW